MDRRVLVLRTYDKCQAFARNAIERGRADLAAEAQRRGVELLAETHGARTAVERECLAAIYAYEAVLTRKHGRTIRANRTWPMVGRLGILGAVEKIVERPDESVAYAALVEMGLADFSFEAVILRHPVSFSPEAVRRSEIRMRQVHGA